MKTLIRPLLLTAAFALTALLPARAVTLGTCSTICSSGPRSQNGSTHVFWLATQSQCCNIDAAPCPAGSVPSGSVYYPPSGVGSSICLYQ
jgi:hypothetical protein